MQSGTQQSRDTSPARQAHRQLAPTSPELLPSTALRLTPTSSSSASVASSASSNSNSPTSSRFESVAYHHDSTTAQPTQPNVSQTQIESLTAHQHHGDGDDDEILDDGSKGHVRRQSGGTFGTPHNRHWTLDSSTTTTAAVEGGQRNRSSSSGSSSSDSTRSGTSHNEDRRAYPGSSQVTAIEAYHSVHPHSGPDDTTVRHNNNSNSNETPTHMGPTRVFVDPNTPPRIRLTALPAESLPRSHTSETRLKQFSSSGGESSPESTRHLTEAPSGTQHPQLHEDRYRDGDGPEEASPVASAAVTRSRPSEYIPRPMPMFMRPVNGHTYTIDSTGQAGATSGIEEIVLEQQEPQQSSSRRPPMLEKVELGSPEALQMLWPLWIFSHIPITVFLDYNTLYILVQISRRTRSSTTSQANPSAWWVAVAGYAFCTVVWIAMVLTTQFWAVQRTRVWTSIEGKWFGPRRKRPTTTTATGNPRQSQNIQSLYLSKPAWNLMALRSYTLFSFLWRVRLAAIPPFATRAIGLDTSESSWKNFIAETCWWYAQNWTMLIVILPKGAVAAALVVAFQNSTAGIEQRGGTGQDSAYFKQAGSLTPFAKSVLLINASWAAWRLVVVTMSAIQLLVLGSTLFGNANVPSHIQPQLSTPTSLPSSNLVTSTPLFTGQSNHSSSPQSWTKNLENRLRAAILLCSNQHGWSGPTSLGNGHQPDVEDRLTRRPNKDTRLTNRNEVTFTMMTETNVDDRVVTSAVGRRRLSKAKHHQHRRQVHQQQDQPEASVSQMFWSSWKRGSKGRSSQESTRHVLGSDAEQFGGSGLTVVDPLLTETSRGMEHQSRTRLVSTESAESTSSGLFPSRSARTSAGSAMLNNQRGVAGLGLGVGIGTTSDHSLTPLGDRLTPKPTYATSAHDSVTPVQMIPEPNQTTYPGSWTGDVNEDVGGSDSSTVETPSTSESLKERERHIWETYPDPTTPTELLARSRDQLVKALEAAAAAGSTTTHHQQQRDLTNVVDHANLKSHFTTESGFGSSSKSTTLNEGNEEIMLGSSGLYFGDEGEVGRINLSGIEEVSNEGTSEEGSSMRSQSLPFGLATTATTSTTAQM